MGSVGPWVQLPDHTFDMHLVYAAGGSSGAHNPASYDPHFAFLGTPTSESGASFFYPKWFDFRWRGVAYRRAQWMSWVYTTTDTSEQVAAEAARQWGLVTQFQDDLAGLPGWWPPSIPAGESEYGTNTPRPGTEWSDGAPAPEVSIDIGRTWGNGIDGQVNTPGYSDVRAANQIGAMYFAPDEQHVLAYHPTPELAPGASGVEWEYTTGEVVGASLWMVSNWFASNSSVAYIGGPSTYQYDHQYTADTRINVRAAPKPELAPRDEFFWDRLRLYSIRPSISASTELTNFPLIYNGGSAAGEGEPDQTWVNVDVTDHLVDGTLTITVAFEQSETGIAPALNAAGLAVPDTHEFSTSYSAGDPSSWGNSGPSADIDVENFGDESVSPYIAWTIRPPRYRFVYDTSIPNMSGAMRDGDAHFTPV